MTNQQQKVFVLTRMWRGAFGMEGRGGRRHCLCSRSRDWSTGKPSLSKQSLMMMLCTVCMSTLLSCIRWYVGSRRLGNDSDYAYSP